MARFPWDCTHLVNLRQHATNPCHAHHANVAQKTTIAMSTLVNDILQSPNVRPGATHRTSVREVYSLFSLSVSH